MIFGFQMRVREREGCNFGLKGKWGLDLMAFPTFTPRSNRFFRILNRVVRTKGMRRPDEANRSGFEKESVVRTKVGRRPDEDSRSSLTIFNFFWHTHRPDETSASSGRKFRRPDEIMPSSGRSFQEHTDRIPSFG